MVDKASAIGMGFCPLLEVRAGWKLHLPSSLISWYHRNMSDAISDTKKSMRGRPKRATTPIMVRVDETELSSLDAWIAANGPPYVTRPEAIRRLVQLGLSKGE